MERFHFNVKLVVVIVFDMKELPHTFLVPLPEAFIYSPALLFIYK